MLSFCYLYKITFKIKIFSAQSFSSSIDLDWHQTPEGQSVFAHLKDPILGTRRSFGEYVMCLYVCLSVCLSLSFSFCSLSLCLFLFAHLKDPIIGSRRSFGNYYIHVCSYVYYCFLSFFSFCLSFCH